MPFVTEELYHLLRPRVAGDDLIVSRTLPAAAFDRKILEEGDIARAAITAIRDVRNKNQLKNSHLVTLHIHTEHPDIYRAIEGILEKQVRGALRFTREPVAGSTAVVIENDRIFIEAPGNTDTSVQKNKLLQDLEHQKGFLASVGKKLANPKFVENARPELVDRERKKQADAEARIRAIEESLRLLGA
jgi:valyl-tRNA synthetase